MAKSGESAKSSPSGDNELPADSPPSRQRGLRRGNPGNKGGRNHPRVYKQWLASLLDSEEHRREFEAATQDRADPAFQFATRHAAEHGIGKPPQQVELTGKDGAPFTIRLVQE